MGSHRCYSSNDCIILPALLCSLHCYIFFGSILCSSSTPHQHQVYRAKPKLARIQSWKSKTNLCSSMMCVRHIPEHWACCGSEMRVIAGSSSFSDIDSDTFSRNTQTCSKTLNIKPRRKGVGIEILG
ncbi:hypothetical protein CIPAW_15G135300 [Carya illinoinensis]|uniref:Uncharacterized protein n=1 Tax=Carya illinoinensis TaxID=32201 RepID=A0A8T1NEX8_CARIL|nr:hypothetical protein CIPAW_15G135300 [Carya illinoinensis]